MSRKFIEYTTEEAASSEMIDVPECEHDYRTYSRCEWCNKPEPITKSGPAMPTLPADKKIFSQRDMDVKRFYQDDGCMYEVNPHGTIKGRQPQYVREEDYESALRELQRLRRQLSIIQEKWAKAQLEARQQESELQRQKYSHKITLDRESATTARYDAKLAALESELQRVKEENANLREVCATRLKWMASAELQLTELKAREAPEDAWKRAWVVALQIPKSNSHYAPEYIAPERSK